MTSRSLLLSSLTRKPHSRAPYNAYSHRHNSSSVYTTLTRMYIAVSSRVRRNQALLLTILVTKKIRLEAQLIAFLTIMSTSVPRFKPRQKKALSVMPHNSLTTPPRACLTLGRGLSLPPKKATSRRPRRRSLMRTAWAKVTSSSISSPRTSLYASNG